MTERAALWPMRTLWLLLPLAIGLGLADAVEQADPSIRNTMVTVGWGGWAAGLVALAVPRAVGLTVLRLVAPGGLVLSFWIALDTGVAMGSRVIAVVAAVVACLVALLPSTGELLVDGSSYGDERRVLLRAPTALIFGPLPLAWAIVAATVAGAPLLLAAKQWVAGTIVLVVGGVVSWLLFVRLHQLSRRWLVFVPAGVVVHDPLTLADPVLFPRQLVAGLGPAPVDNQALDLTRGATGLALMLSTLEPIVVAPAVPGQELTQVGVTAVLVTPTRPGHVLRIAEDRRIPIG